MVAQSKKNVFIILTVALLGAIAVICILINRNDEAEGDISVYCGDYARLSIVPFETQSEEEGAGTSCFFLPFPAETGAYRIDFPKDDRVYIDGDEYFSGDALRAYVSGEMHRLEVIRHGKTVGRDVVFYYANSVPAVSVDMENGAFEKMSEDPMHLNKKTSTITIVDPDTHLNTSEYCFIGGAWRLKLGL